MDETSKISKTTNSHFRWLINRPLWAVLMSLLVLISYDWNKQTLEKHALSQALERGRYTFKIIETTRLWLAQHGVAYVARTTKTPSNPYLKVDEKDIETPLGVELTAVNPAYMTRQLAELLNEKHNLAVHLTSLKLLNPGNKADPWETSVLTSFEQAVQEEVIELVQDDSQTIARYMAPLYVKEACLQCHGHQGYQVGDIRGGISVSFDYAPFRESNADQLDNLQVIHLIIWVVLTSLILMVINLILRHKTTIESARDEAERLTQERTSELQKALAEIKTLKGIISICSYCHKIRDDEGAWEHFETYISKYSDARFSHSVCPSCIPQARHEAGLDTES